MRVDASRKGSLGLACILGLDRPAPCRICVVTQRPGALECAVMAKEEDTKATADETSKTGASAEAIVAAKTAASDAHAASTSAADDDEADDDDDGRDDADGDDADGDDADGDDADGDDAEPVEAEAAVAKADAGALKTAEARATAARGARPRPVRAEPPPPPPAPNTSVRVIAFVGVLVVLMSGFWLLSGFDSGLDNKPVVNWRTGQMVDLELTLVRDDATSLACSSPQDLGGKKCQFSNKTDTNAGLTDATTYKPYMTTDGVQVLAAGLWSLPTMDRSKLPTDRFAVKCKLKVEGKIKAPLIRWNPSMTWIDKKEDWNAGTLSDCKVNPP